MLIGNAFYTFWREWVSGLDGVVGLNPVSLLFASQY